MQVWSSDSVIRGPADGVYGAHCPCECFGLVLFWDSGVFKLVAVSFGLFFGFFLFEGVFLFFISYFFIFN